MNSRIKNAFDNFAHSFGIRVVLAVICHGYTDAADKIAHEATDVIQLNEQNTVPHKLHHNTSEQ